MKVYIVDGCIPHSGDPIFEAFASKSKALKKIAEYNKDESVNLFVTRETLKFVDIPINKRGILFALEYGADVVFK